jgi:MarR family
LSSAATTTLINRLEREGLVRRVCDTADRRKILVELTDAALQQAHLLYGVLAAEGARLLAATPTSSSLCSAITSRPRESSPTSSAIGLPTSHWAGRRRRNKLTSPLGRAVLAATISDSARAEPEIAEIEQQLICRPVAACPADD